MNKTIKLKFYSTENIEIGLIYGGIFQKYGYSLIDTNDEIIENSLEYESSNGSPLIVSKNFRIDKKFKVFCNRLEYISLLQMLEKKRNEKNPFMVVSSYNLKGGLESYTHLKYGYLKTPTNIIENINYFEFECKLKEGF